MPSWISVASSSGSFPDVAESAFGKFLLEAISALEGVLLGVWGEFAVFELCFDAAHSGGEAVFVRSCRSGRGLRLPTPSPPPDLLISDFRSRVQLFHSHEPSGPLRGLSSESEGRAASLSGAGCSSAAALSLRAVDRQRSSMPRPLGLRLRRLAMALVGNRGRRGRGARWRPARRDHRPVHRERLRVPPARPRHVHQGCLPHQGPGPRPTPGRAARGPLGRAPCFPHQ